MDNANRKRAHLQEFGKYVYQAVNDGALTRTPVQIRDMETIDGPRAGAVKLNAGVHTGRLLEVFRRNDYATTAQFIPWDFPGQPLAYMSGRYLRLEAGWPKGLAEDDITLRSLSRYPKNGGRWVAGKNEGGQTIILHVDDDVPSWLIAGTSGSGKSFAMQTAAAQLSQDPANRIVLLDPKVGEGLGPVRHLPRQIGPMAIDQPSIKKALAWLVTEMVRRYRLKLDNGSILPQDLPRIIIFMDEIQIITGEGGDEDIIRFVHKLASEGRAARMHLVVGTQKPSAKAFSHDAIKSNLVGRLALLVKSYKDSEVAVGGNTPRADRLQNQGDAFAIVPSSTQRTQLAYIPRNELGPYTRGPSMEHQEWPDVTGEELGTAMKVNIDPDPRTKTQFNGTEIAISMLLAARKPQPGRPTLQNVIEGEIGSRPGGTRAATLLKLGRDSLTELKRLAERLA